jgi:pimeloyl-ACP methyl ester carboxylesterase
MEIRTSDKSGFFRTILLELGSLFSLVITGFSLLTSVFVSAAEVRTNSVESGDGVRIVYDVRGQGDPTLLFVHCWAGNRFFWRDQADAFADKYQVVTLDLGGHGESGRNRKHWSILGLSEDVRTVANALKLEHIILIGHSMGGPVSLEAARLLPGRVLGVVLVDTMHNVEVPRSMESAQADAEKLRNDFGGYMGDLSLVFTKTSDPSIRHWVEKQALAADPAVCIALKLDTPNLDLKKLFTNARVPIRAINAKPPLSDPTNVEGNRKYADYSAILMDDVGHFVELERPKEFNENLSKCLVELSK